MANLQEDGLVKAVNAFHAHLPLDKMRGANPAGQGHEAMWSDVARPHFSNFVHEAGRGVVGIVAQPVRGYKKSGNVLQAAGLGSQYYDLLGCDLPDCDLTDYNFPYCHGH